MRRCSSRTNLTLAALGALLAFSLSCAEKPPTETISRTYVGKIRSVQHEQQRAWSSAKTIVTCDSAVVPLNGSLIVPLNLDCWLELRTYSKTYNAYWLVAKTGDREMEMFASIVDKE